MSRKAHTARIAATMAALLLVAACQSAPPVEPRSDATTLGDWTVRTSGRVTVETGVVH
jgi:hypothetical protein